MDDFTPITFGLMVRIGWADCLHGNGEWDPAHFWRCKSCKKPIPPKSNTIKQKVAVFYAPHWDEFRKTEMGLLN